MEKKVCMNEQCGASLPSSIECKKGWRLRSGELASLCHSCGTVYEQLVFCETFHSKDTGWRDCTSCGKRLHCGCIASSSLLELLDSGGVKCISCSEIHGLCSTSSREKCKDSGVSAANGDDEKQFTNVGNQSSIRIINKMKFADFGDDGDANDHSQLPPSQTDDAIEAINQMKAEETCHPVGEFGSSFLSFLGQSSIQSTQNVKQNEYMENVHGPPVRTNLTISLSASSGNADPLPPVVVEERQPGKKISSSPQGSKSRHLFPKPPKSILAAGVETNASTVSQIRVARPPVEGRVKNHLLPRYWPRITDQELQQISGDSNSTVVPLFEKVLSASDAGRIGRLVLPKACAEAYFPPISQPEGLPLRIQDVKGKEWVFQFRFWPNNNSRMYVLEGVTPCIQSMQLQAGDTVTFSRMDPEGKLLMGFRKASKTLIMQDKHLPSMPNSAFSSEPFLLPVNENLHSVSSHNGLLQSLKGRDFPLGTLSKHFNGGDFSWHMAESNGGKTGDGPMSSSTLVLERKRSRNIGSKNKRLLIDSQDALELRLSWEELQDMLRPPSGIEPSTVTIEDYELEEYEQPPVLGKKSIFTVRLSGEQEQWVECDSCSKWRRLPADILLPPKWTCQDNTWNLNRASCSVPDELSPQELENLLHMSKELKKERIGAGLRSGNVYESSNPDTLGNSTAIGGNVSEVGASSVATTTKHPRHRPGCSCIVCIQPPSGKGKHKPTCTCNVCMTVKRRFKTLMMRKKKRQSEREAEIAQRNQFIWERKEEGEVESFRAQLASPQDSLENQRRLGSELQIRSQISQQSQKPVEIGDEKLDLNSHPDRENLHTSSSRISMVSLLQEASLPLETYLKQNGLTSLVCDQQASSGSLVLQQATRESENISQGIQEPVDGTEELSETEQSDKDPS